MDSATRKQIADLLKQAHHAADAKTNGLLDRDELTMVIRELIASTQQLLLETEGPALWPDRAPRLNHQSLQI